MTTQVANGAVSPSHGQPHAATADLKRLCEPFPSQEIKQREGQGGKQLDYVEFGDVARRLIEATGNKFKWEVVSMQMSIANDKNNTAFWTCHGRLTVDGASSRDGIGTHPNYDIESPKAAESDAFKRAAVKFGVGLELYDKDRPKGTAAGQAAQQRAGFATGANGANGASNGSRGSNGLIWEGPGLCPNCHAPEGKKHGKQCLG